MPCFTRRKSGCSPTAAALGEAAFKSGLPRRMGGRLGCATFHGFINPCLVEGRSGGLLKLETLLHAPEQLLVEAPEIGLGTLCCHFIKRLWNILERVTAHY